jgi:hypothetical protein
MTDGEQCAIILPELHKRDHLYGFETFDRNEAQLSVYSNEECAVFAFQVVLGCINRAIKLQFITSGIVTLPDGTEFQISAKKGNDPHERVILNPHLADLLRNLFTSSDLPNIPSRQSFRDFISAKLGNPSCQDKTEENRIAEAQWVYLCKKVPGFLYLCQRFTFYWLPSVVIDIKRDSCKVIKAHFFEQNGLDDAGGDTMEFGYRLLRIGVAESENYIIRAPAYTKFHPYETDTKGRSKRLALVELQSLSPEPTVSIEARVSMDEHELRVRMDMSWDSSNNKPYRRLPLPYQNEVTRQSDWGSEIFTRMQRFVIHTKWRAEPGKRGDSYFYFFLLSFCALLLMAVLPPMESDTNNYGIVNVTMIIVALAPVLALLFSDIQERMPYYRRRLMKSLQQSLRMVAIAVTGACVISLLPLNCLIEGNPLLAIIINKGAIVVALLIVMSRVISILRWRRRHHGDNCRDKLWLPFSNGVERIAPSRETL